MSTLHILLTLFCGIAVFQGFFLSAYLFSQSQQQKSLAPVVLGIIFLGLSLRIGKSLIYYIFIDIPYSFIGLGLAGKLAAGPMVFLYIQHLRGKTLHKKTVLLHLISSLLSIGVAWTLSMSTLTVLYRIGTIILASYLLYAGYLYVNSRQQIPPSKTRWAQLLLGSVSLICLCFMYQLISNTLFSYAMGAACASLVLYGINFWVMRNPHTFQALSSKAHKTKKRPGLDPTLRQEIKQQLERLLQEEQAYKNASINLNQVSTQLNIPSYLLSKVINQEYGKRFPEFVNAYRIAEVKIRLQTPSEKLVTIESLAFDAGFNTLSAFYSAFKKETAMSPQAYRKQFVKTA